MKNKTITKTIMFLLLILGGSGLCLADDKAQAADWYSPDWEYRKAITVDNTASADALTDYQILVTLNSGNFDYAKANIDGYDLRFIDSDKLTEISYWIKEWNATGDSKIWVKVPVIPAGDTATIYLYYGNDKITEEGDSLSSFDGAMQKLQSDADTVALWHFDEGTGTTLGDSSGNGNNGTLNNFVADDGDWIADSTSEYGGSGGALNFNGDPDGDEVGNYIEAAHDTSLNFGSGDFTIEGWIKTTAETSSDLAIINKCTDLNETGFHLSLDGLSIHSLKYTLLDENDWTLLWSDATVNDGNWHYVVVLRDETEIRNYVDGEFDLETAISELIDISNNVSLLFGKTLGDDSFFIGQMDEFRISNRALSADEIKANYERRQYAATEPLNDLGVEEADPYDTSETVVAETGGTVTNTADTVTVDIPADALSTDTIITIETSEAVGEAIENFQIQDTAPIDYVYTFGPEGTTFLVPVTLTFNYDDTGMTLAEEQGLDIYLYNETLEIWEAQGAAVDTTLNTLTLSVTHFSSYVIGGNIVALGKIDELLLSINNYYEEGEIEKSAYSLSVHLRRVQRLLKEGKNEKAMTVLGKFIEKVERFTPNKIDPVASAVIIAKANEIIVLLQ